MGNVVNGYDIVFRAVVDGKEKLFAGTKSNSFSINPRIKESITKEDKGTSSKKITGYDSEFGIEGVMVINTTDEKQKKVDCTDIIDLVTAGNELPFVYGDPAPGKTVYKGNMVITAYSENTDAEGEATYSVSCSAVTKLTKEIVPEDGI